MLHSPTIQASMESINFQRQSLLLKELSMIIEKAQTSDNPSNALRNSNMSKVIFDYTGIKVKTHIDRSPYINAYVMIPNIDRNHPVLVDFFREHFDGSDGFKMIKKNGGVLKGWVDREKSKIGGSFSEVEIKMGITQALLQSTFFSAEEIASVVLHELGHIFTYFEYLGTGITTNYVLQTISRELMGTREIRRKYEIIKEGSKVLDIEIDDPEALIRARNETVIQTVVLSKVMQKRHSELGSKTYDYNAWEMLSDQFATRHGAGRHLVTALDSLHRLGGDTGHLSTKDYLANEALKILMVMITGPFALLIIPMLLVFVDTNEDLYDGPKDRMERIRRDMVNAAKNRDLDKDYRSQLIEDIEVIENITKEMNNKRTFLQYFHSTVYAKGRHQYNQKLFQQELEMLTNNDVFVKAQKLKSLSI